MKRICAMVMLFAGVLSAQVLTDATTIKAEKFNFGFAPSYYANKAAIFVSAGTGITRNSDVELTVGFPQREHYVGIMNKWNLSRSYGPQLSFSYGAHTQGDVYGIDGTINLSFKLSMTSRLYVGVDFDANFKSGTQQNLLWGFIGITDNINEDVAYFIEAQPALNFITPNIYSVGIKILLN